MTLNPTTVHDALPTFKAAAPLQESFLAQTLIALVAIVAVVAIMMVNGFLVGGMPRGVQPAGQLPNMPAMAPRSATSPSPSVEGEKSVRSNSAAPCLPCGRSV